jgi:hypothetical protein
MTATIESLEEQFNLLIKGVKSGSIDVQRSCLMVIELSGANTMAFGHSRRADRVKNRTYEILGAFLGLQGSEETCL